MQSLKKIHVWAQMFRGGGGGGGTLIFSYICRLGPFLGGS